MITNKSVAFKIISIDEGYSELPYYCTEGYLTTGYGRRISKPSDIKPYDEELKYLQTKISYLNTTLETKGIIKESNGVYRNGVLISLAYQLGTTGLKKFKRFLSNLDKGQYEASALELIDSNAYRQVPERFTRNAYIIESNKLHSYYCK